MATNDVNMDTERLSDALEAAAKSLSEESVGEINSLTLSSGVVVGINRISPMVFQEVDQRFPDPPVPKIEDPEQGRVIENPMHPAYLAEIKRVREAKSLATMDTIAVLGTYLISLPDGFDGPDSEEWKDKMDFLGYDQKLIDRKLTRYLAWLKAVGAPDIENDWNRISMAVLRKTGVTEGDVQKALANFRDQGEKQADNAGEAEVQR